MAIFLRHSVSVKGSGNRKARRLFMARNPLGAFLSGDAMSEIAYGCCHCGCGGKTGIAKRNRPGRGHIKGEHFRFIHSHHRDLSGSNNGHWKGGVTRDRGYVFKYNPTHPKALPNGYVHEAILVCEKALGKALPVGAIPHHIDENKSNNDNSNLVLCQDRAYHNFLHQRMRAYRACGHADWRKCQYCDQYASPDDLHLVIRRGKVEAIYHVGCAREMNRFMNINRKKANTDPIFFDGKLMSISEWARYKNISVSTLFSRIKRGWSIENALTIPTIKRVRK